MSAYVQQSAILNIVNTKTSPPYHGQSLTSSCRRHQLLCAWLMLKTAIVLKKMAAGKRYFVILLLIFFLTSVCCLPEPGKKDLHFKKVNNICARCLNSLAEYCILCLSWIMLERHLYFFLYVDSETLRFVYVFTLKIYIVMFVYRTKRLMSLPKQWTKATVLQ